MIPIHDDNPGLRTPWVTRGLALACIAAFAWQLSWPPALAQYYLVALGMVPALLLGHAQLNPQLELLPPALTTLSSMFLHGGLLHLGGNLLYLWIFADNVEDALGHGRFLVFYLLCGAVAACAHALSAPQSEVPMVGASGAISGVLGAYLLLFPRTTVTVLVPLVFVWPVLRMPALLVLGGWFLMQLVESLLTPAGVAGTAFVAHIGGFIAGLVLVRAFLPVRPVSGR